MGLLDPGASNACHMSAPLHVQRAEEHRESAHGGKGMGARDLGRRDWSSTDAPANNGLETLLHSAVSVTRMYATFAASGLAIVGLAFVWHSIISRHRRSRLRDLQGPPSPGLFSWKHMRAVLRS